MTSTSFDALRDAVRAARDRQIKSVAELRHALRDMGHTEADISTAIETWRQYCRRNVNG